MVIAIRKDDDESSVINLEVESTTTITNLKRELYRLLPEKLSPELALRFNGKPLQDGLTLGDYGVEPQSTLVLCEILCLHIQLPSKETTHIKVLSSETVGDVKNQVIRKEHLPNADWHLRHHSNWLFLDNSKTFSDNNIQHGSVLHLSRMGNY